MVRDTSIITMVGAGKYQTTRYQFKDGTLSDETTIFSKALMEHYKDKLDTVIILGTETSRWSSILPEKGGDEISAFRDQRVKSEESNSAITVEEFEKLKTLLNGYYRDYNVVVLKQKADLNEEDIAVYSDIFKNIKSKSKIVFDITSGFRYMPLFVFESLQTYSPDIDVNDISVVYAEANGFNNPFIVRDVSRAWRAAEINKALYTFKTTLDGIKLSMYLKKINYDISNWIKRFSKNIQKSYLALCDYNFFEKLRETIFLLNVEDLHKPYLEETIKFLKEKILPEFDYLKDKPKEARRSWCLFTLSGILDQFDLHSQALIALKESGQMRIIEAKKPNLLYKKKIKPKDLAPYEEEVKKDYLNKLNVTELWYELKDVRNDGAHAGIELIYHKEKIVPSSNFSKYQEMIKKVLENVPCKVKNASGC